MSTFKLSPTHLAIIAGLALETFAPPELRPSTYIIQRIINLVNLENRGTQEAKAQANAVNENITGTVKNALEAKNTQEISRIEAEASARKVCLSEIEANKVRVRNECFADPNATAILCDFRVQQIEENGCPGMPTISRSNQTVLDAYERRDYRIQKGGEQ